jgi:multicomponent Na+:H+ antiporter subunit G
MSLALDIASWICLVAGGGFAVAGGIGMLRMPNLFTRMHAASVVDTTGAGLILLGLMLQSGFTLNTAKLLVLGLLLLFTTPAATHALAKAAIARGMDPAHLDDTVPQEGEPSKR